MITDYTTYIKENNTPKREVFNYKGDIINYLQFFFKIPTHKIIVYDDLSVDIKCAFRIHVVTKMDYLPINFNIVDGEFDISGLDLISLEGCPKIVNGGFNCNDNELESLKYGPEEVYGYYSCRYNNIKNLEGSPLYIRDGFDCSSNPLQSLKGCPKPEHLSISCLRCQKYLRDITDLPINVAINILRNDGDSWLNYLNPNVLDEYIDLHLQKDSSLLKIFDKYMSKDLKEKYSHLYQAKNFDLI
jgi:hypothetical protein